MRKKQLIIRGYFPFIFEKESAMEQYFEEGYTPEIAKSFCPEALDVKKEYHSMNEKERQWIIRWVLNMGKVFTYAFMGIFLVFEIIALACWWSGIGNCDTETLTLISAASGFGLIICFLVPLRNKWILKHIDFDNVQECIIHGIIGSGYGKTRSRFYAILRWNEKSQKFYEVLYMPDLPGCGRKDILYHPYGMKIYIPKMKE